MSTSDNLGSQPERTLEERRLEYEISAKERELDLSEREIAAKEREVAAKEKELQRSRWLNPTVIGIFAAAIGLIGSLVVARVNNDTSQRVERLRSQSNLVLEAIKTGNANEACKNLVFFVGLGLLDDDPQQTIRKSCSDKPKGAPSLPAAGSAVETAAVDPTKCLRGHVYDADSGQPIPGARVSIAIAFFAETLVTDSTGAFLSKNVASTAAADLNVSKDGYVTYTHRGLRMVDDKGNFVDTKNPFLDWAT